MESTSAAITKIRDFLKSLPNDVKNVATPAAAQYLIGNQSHGLKHEPSYKYVNRYAGFPNLSFITSTGKIIPGYASAKQFAYVHAMIAKGVIKPGQDNRTHFLTNSISYVTQGARYVITIAAGYAQYVMGSFQTRMHNLIGWRVVIENVRDNANGAIRAAVNAINNYLKGKNGV